MEKKSLKFWQWGLWSLLLFMGMFFVGTLWNFQKPFAKGGDFELIHGGAPWRFSQNSRELTVLYVGYAQCPDVCPMALSYSAQAFQKLSEIEINKIQFVFISVDVPHDTPQSVSQYAKQFHPGFIGLTGDQKIVDSVVQLMGASYVVEKNPESYLGYSIAHSDRLFFLNNKGIVLGTLPSPRSGEIVLKHIREYL